MVEVFADEVVGVYLVNSVGVSLVHGSVNCLCHCALSLMSQF